jgi:hypothetical protein
MRSHRSFHGEMDQIRKEVMGLAMELVSGCNFKRAMHERGTIVSERRQACQLVRRVVKYIGTICSASCIQMGKGPQLQERNDMLGNLGAGFWLVEPAGGFSKCPLLTIYPKWGHTILRNIQRARHRTTYH